MLSRYGAALLLAAAVLPLHAGPPEPGKTDDRASVEILRSLLTDLQTFNNQGRPTEDRRISFELPETVVNQYLAVSMALIPRPMLQSLHVKLLGQNRCVVEARVDFDALRKAEPLAIPKTERAVWKGTRSVKAEFRFTVIAGTLKFEAVPMPSDVTPNARALAEIIRVIAAGQPEKIDTRHRIPLPFGLRRVWMDAQSVGGET